ncbi:MAG: NTP transferase domain-containing protein [Thermoplasmata archaeon]
MNLSMVILAGGTLRKPGSVRLRALLPLKEKPIILWTLEALSRFPDEIIVATAHGWVDELKRRLPRRVRVVEDELVGFGALGGMHVGARAARGRWMAVSPSEAPFSSPEIYKLLLREARGKKGAVPHSGGVRRYLHAVYARDALLARIEKAFLKGESEVSAALKGMGLAVVGPRKLARVDNWARSFVVLKSMDAIRAVEARL